MEKTGFLEEQPGKKSVMRLGFLSGLYYAMLMGIWVFAVTHEVGSLIAVVTSLSATFGVQKLIQNHQENRAAKNSLVNKNNEP